ncbi:MAG: YdcF family protein [Lachnospiraceae bacterium]|nr:YdcF family protein [Lachnospiraceae bacterium]MDD7178606.1 YdcF family protein [bacterium]MDY5516705.1 YdcF family protein [Lachnospiraceae bacterium]
MTKMILIVIGIMILMGTALAAAAMIAIHQGAKGQTVAEDTPAVVLGCHVRDGRPSRILGERIDAAYEYLCSHPKAIAVLSGGQGEDESISEAECMYRELTARGIDGSRLYKEESSVNTPTNLRQSRIILEEALGADSTWTEKHEIALITSEFHCYRGCLHAKQEGLKPVAYASKTAIPYVIPFYVREIAAVVYTWFFR